MNSAFEFIHAVGDATPTERLKSGAMQRKGVRRVLRRAEIFALPILGRRNRWHPPAYSKIGLLRTVKLV
jgi:hypothetical protein